MDQISEECDLQLKRRARKGVNRLVKSRERRRGDVKRRQGDVKRRQGDVIKFQQTASSVFIICVHQTNLQIHNKHHHQWRSKTMKHEQKRR